MASIVLLRHVFIVSVFGVLSACGGGGDEAPNGNPPPGGNPTNTAPTAVITAGNNSGVVAFQFDANATLSSDSDGTIVSYAWDFGDGNSAQVPVVSHTYNLAGTYSVSLSITDDGGARDTTSLTVHVFDSLDNDQVTVPAGIVFFDDFEYAVGRDNDPNAYATFTAPGKWSHAKAENVTGSHAGYLYTVDSIPGYTGSFPGRSSGSVLAIEARPGSMATQTDFYLQYGNENAAADTIPADVWFQYWIYPNRAGNQMSAFAGRNKFIYPCNASYPCTDGNYNWLNTLGFTTGEPHWANQDNTQLYITTINSSYYPVTPIDYQLAPEWDQFKIGQTDVSENLVPNRWTLVKLHYDTSSTSGTFEAWLKPLGGQWVKVAEWIDGVTPDFSWQIPPQDVGGHRVFRMPTTMDDYDSWVYLDDFAMAASESELPVYPY